MLLISAVAEGDTGCPFIGETSFKKVQWTDLLGVEIQGDSLHKTGPDGWNSAAFSSDYIADDGAVEFAVRGTSTSRMLGLAYENTDARFEGINYAVFLTSYGRLYIFENGVQRGNYSTYDEGDVIRIERKKGQVSYLKNGHEIYSSSIPSAGNLYVDVSLYSKDASIDQTEIFGAGTATVNVDWTDQLNVKIRQDMLVKAGGTGWHSGASSQQFIPGDGAVDFTVQSNDDTLVVGFSRNATKGDYKRIDFAIFLSANGGFYVYEHGFNKGNFGNYRKKDTFRIERQGSKVIYSRNCEPFYISKQPSSGQLMTAVSLYSRGARISHTTMYGASQ
jgi:hypothetical protein